MCLTLVGCSNEQPTSTTVWSYEKLTYRVTESETASNVEGTLVITAEALIEDIEYKIPQINEDGELVEKTVALPNGSHILEGVLTFGEDTLVYQTVTTSGFRPIYSYKALMVGAEMKAYDGDAPTCLSYVLTTAYDKTQAKATSSYLRRKDYGEASWDGTFSTDHWYFYTKNYEEIQAPYCDVNQIYYSLRAIDQITNDDFSYTLHVPMALEMNTKNLYCTSTPNESVATEVIPFVKNNYGADYELFVNKVTIVPQDSSVTGKGIEISYAQSELYSKEEIEAGALSEGSTIKGHKKVPIRIRENIKTGDTENMNGRGTIVYTLTDFSTERPER